jgi:hypothetical protein
LFFFIILFSLHFSFTSSALADATSFARCLCICPQCILIGTVGGFIYAADFYGNIVKQFKISDFPVNDISCSEKHFAAAATDDGHIFIIDIFGKGVIGDYTHDRPMYSVCVHPQYSDSKREFIAGGAEEKLTHTVKGLYIYIYIYIFKLYL